MKKKDYSDVKRTLKKQRALLLRADKNLEREIESDVDTHHGDDVDIAEADAEREMSFYLKNRGQDEIKLIDEALDRIEKGEYGLCAECGDDIPPKRLEALPFSIYCVTCQEELEAEAELSASQE
jgi:DnaK suppressor protein